MLPQVGRFRLLLEPFRTAFGEDHRRWDKAWLTDPPTRRTGAPTRSGVTPAPRFALIRAVQTMRFAQ